MSESYYSFAYENCQSWVWGRLRIERPVAESCRPNINPPFVPLFQRGRRRVAGHILRTNPCLQDSGNRYHLRETAKSADNGKAMDSRRNPEDSEVPRRRGKPPVAPQPR